MKIFENKNTKTLYYILITGTTYPGQVLILHAIAGPLFFNGHIFFPGKSVH